ncbi:hypothetical protein [Streptomyces sp. AK02-01A]|uniref:hypothetical protein n=1 Tax=Streptomyces sp. AK02-01A TaxID=3028648 RepID=UPI0029BD34CE|nr:hypothetical protein [Streptomyces sp. AK02-01A]MDX3853155.1 hypothetical protein [Streptomyces sp. AK02-01A]
MATASRGTHAEAVGPGTDLAQVLHAYEREGHQDPAAAWESFTAAWNWAAPLPAALPADHGRLTTARPVPGGFSLSGVWRIPSDVKQGRWLALPLTDRCQQPRSDTVERGPDVFVVSSNVLPHSQRRHRVTGGTDTYEPAFRLDKVYVPGGFATSSAGTPLRTEDAAFLWTAVTAMALGSARRLTGALAALAQDEAAFPVAAAMPAAAAAAELAAALHDERLCLAVTLRSSGASSVAPGAAVSFGHSLTAPVRRTSNMVHEVVAAAYEYAAPFHRSSGHHPLVSLIESSTPVLQCMRFAVELLPPGDATSTAEGPTS